MFESPTSLISASRAPKCGFLGIGGGKRCIFTPHRMGHNCSERAEGPTRDNALRESADGARQ